VSHLALKYQVAAVLTVGIAWKKIIQMNGIPQHVQDNTIPLKKPSSNSEKKEGPFKKKT